MLDVVYNANLDMHDIAPRIQIAAVEGDTARRIRFMLTEDGKPKSIDRNECTAMISAIKPDGYTLLDACEIKGDGTIEYVFTEQMTAAPGIVECILKVIKNDGITIVGAPPFTIYVNSQTFDGRGVESADSWNAIATYAKTAEKAATAATTATGLATIATREANDAASAAELATRLCDDAASGAIFAKSVCEEAAESAGKVNVSGSKTGNTARFEITSNTGATRTIEIYDGAKGDKGDRGETGPAGPSGPKGDPGESALYPSLVMISAGANAFADLNMQSTTISDDTVQAITNAYNNNIAVSLKVVAADGTFIVPMVQVVNNRYVFESFINPDIYHIEIFGNTATFKYQMF